MREIAPRISNPGSRFGRPVITGTRVPIDVLVRHVAAGDEIDLVALEYGVAREDVLAAMAYAAGAVADEHVRLVHP